MSNIILPYKFTPREYQLAFYRAFDNPNLKSFFMRWCRRAGKDKTCISAVAKKMLERVGAYYYCFPIYAQARKALWEGRDKDGMRFLEHIPGIDGSPETRGLIKNINNTEMKIELINGSILRMIGSDNYNTVVGTNPLGIVYSEYSLQDPKARQYLSPILAENNGWEIIQGTPRGKNHMYETEQTLLRNKKAYVSHVQTLWKDLPGYYPLLTLDQINAEREKGMSEEMLEQEFGASYEAGVQGAYYADQLLLARAQGRIGMFPHDDHCYVDTFWDIGLNDNCVIWFRQMRENAMIWIDFYEDNGKSVAEIVEMLARKGYKYRTHYLPHDGSHRSKATKVRYKDDLADACRQAKIADDIICAEKPDLKITAINKVRARFSRYFFNEINCLKGITKLALYHKHFDSKKNTFIDQPVHDDCSHVADALSTEALSAHLQYDPFKSKTPRIITEFDPLEYEAGNENNSSNRNF